MFILLLLVMAILSLSSSWVMPPLVEGPISLYGSNGQPGLFDVVQRLTPDCWLEATLAAVVRVNPDKITQMLHDNGDGTVTVHLFDPSSLAAVNPPPRVLKKTPVAVLEYDNANTVWVQVIQDALNPLVNGTVFNGHGGYATQALSAIYGEAAVFTACDQLLNLASRATVNPLIFCTNDATGPLVNGHSYTLEGITQTSGSTGVIMRNPWGIVNENVWGIETSDGVQNLGHGQFVITNEKAQPQCDAIAHLQSMQK
jgi:hypothetical protein